MDEVNTTMWFIQEKPKENLVESKSVGSTFLKGKECLRSLNECIDKDTMYQASASYFINYLINKAAPINLNGFQDVSEECQQSHQIFIEDLYNFKYWALQMYDASAKLPSGLLHGNVLQFGDFDLCMKSKNLAHNIYGQYCLANIQFEVPTSAYLAAIYNLIHSHGIIRSKLSDPGHRVPRFSSIQWAVCVPDACTPKDVDVGIKEVLKHIFNGTGIQYNTLLDSTLCSTGKQEDRPVSTILACLLFLFIFLFEVFASLYNMYCKNKNNVILAFSIKNNFLKLRSLKNNDIEAIHLVRFMNGLMLMAAHKSMAIMYLPYINRTSAAEDLGAAWTVIARAASLYTDPFIMISGTLTTYSLIGKLNSSKRINVIEEYTSRILRILPTLIVVIIFCTLVLPWINAGPLWKSVVTHHSDICKTNWWKNILFIHNYFGFENMCLTHTHHVGIDMQLFFVSPLLVLLIWRWPKRGLISLCILATISTWMRYHSTYTRNLSNFVYYGASSEQLFLTADYMYIIPVYRLTVYIMGIVLGYLLRQHSNVRFKQQAGSSAISPGGPRRVTAVEGTSRENFETPTRGGSNGPSLGLRIGWRPSAVCSSGTSGVCSYGLVVHTADAWVTMDLRTVLYLRILRAGSSLSHPISLQSVKGCLETTADYPHVPGSCEDANVVRVHRQVEVRGCWNIAGVNAEQEG
ncbi:hypothetical protein Trydic_g8420 [Trypoxylus dichotomus]